ncbi:MAG: DUF4363 family protein [Oscillospiraceae bacterium]|nr:DUF4363 family protein [Oscillospiraceae bacterium]
MKRIIICAFIMVVVIILGIASYICTDNTLNEAEQTVSDISLSFEKGDMELTRAFSEKLSEEWEEDCENYMFIIDKDYMIEITLAVSRIEEFARDENPEVLVECRAVLGLMELCREKENIELRNIF